MRASVAAENRKAAPGVPVLQEPVLGQKEETMSFVNWKRVDFAMGLLILLYLVHTNSLFTLGGGFLAFSIILVLAG